MVAPSVPVEGTGETRFPQPPAPGKVVSGRALPSQTLPRAGSGGKPVSPTPPVEGCALPDPPAGGGMGKPGFPTPPVEGFALPDPRGRGYGETRFPHPLLEGQALPRAGGWGNPVSPHPRLRAASSQTLPRAGYGETRFPQSLLEGQALPRVGAWGNPVSPHPSSRAYVHVSDPAGAGRAVVAQGCPTVRGTWRRCAGQWGSRARRATPPVPGR